MLTTEIAERLQFNCIPGVLKYSNGNKKRSASIFFTPTNDNEITTIIKDLKNKQSSGLDGVSSFLIKKCHVYLIKPLTFLTNLSLSTGKFLENLKISKIKPLLKKGAPNEIQNYRPVSLVSTFSKILEKVVHIRPQTTQTQRKEVLPNSKTHR
jgi:Notch-like protein